MTPLTPSRVVELLKDKASKAQADAKELHECLMKLNSISGHDARMFTIMSQCKYEDAMLFTEATKLIKSDD